MLHRRHVYIYLLNVPSFSSRYFNKIKRTFRLGRLLGLSLEILCSTKPFTVKEIHSSCILLAYIPILLQVFIVFLLSYVKCALTVYMNLDTQIRM